MRWAELSAFRRILLYLAIISATAIVYVVARGTDGVTVRTIVAAVFLAPVLATLVWVRRDYLPEQRRRRDGNKI